MLLLTCATAALAMPRNVLPFDADTWGQLAHAPARPLAVVFSTTDCAHCPTAIDAIAATLRQAKAPAHLVVVVMDGAGAEDALRQDRHYRQAQALYVFDGDAAALRYTVNPDWRGLTPYVALIATSGTVRFYAGAPPTDAVREWLRRR